MAKIRSGIENRLARMIKVPTVSAEITERTMRPFNDFMTLLGELYPQVHERLTLEKVGDLGLLYRWAGKNESLQPAVLMAHFDVVPVDENDAWTFPPFEGKIHEDWVYGRGTLDDKGPLVVILDAVENLLRENFTPERDIYLSFGGNEETFGDAANETAKLLESRGIIPWLVIDEGGAVVDSPLPFVEGDFAMIGLGEKGIATVRLSAQSQGGHASTPQKLTAVSRLARAIMRLSPETFTAKTPVTVTKMLEAFAKAAPEPAATALRFVASKPILSSKLLAKAGGEMAAMVRTTIAPTRVSGGTADNVLPSLVSATLNLRIAPGETFSGAVRRIRERIADPLITVELVEGTNPTPESSAENEQFKLICDSIAVSHPEAIPVPYLVMAATDSRYYHRFSPATYRFAPLKMSAEQRATIHGVDERVEIAELERGEIFYRTLIKRI